MDGYLDQQVPYTLANVRIFGLTLHFSFAWFFTFLLPGFVFVFYISLGVASARVLAGAAVCACAR